MEDRALEGEQGERDLSAPQAAPGKDGFHLFQRKGGGALTIGDYHGVEHQIRIEALPARLDVADRHRLTNGLTDRLLDLSVIDADIGQNKKTQAEDQQRKKQPGGERQPPGHNQRNVQRG